MNTPDIVAVASICVAFFGIVIAFLGYLMSRKIAYLSSIDNFIAFYNSLNITKHLHLLIYNPKYNDFVLKYPTDKNPKSFTGENPLYDYFLSRIGIILTKLISTDSYIKRVSGDKLRFVPVFLDDFMNFDVETEKIIEKLFLDKMFKDKFTGFDNLSILVNKYAKKHKIDK